MPETKISLKKTSSVKELAKIYSAADLFLNLSYCENYPTVNLESLSCGTPVITYDAGGSPETLSDQNSIVVKRGDLREISDSIKKYHCSVTENRSNDSVDKMDKESTLSLYLDEIRGYWTFKNSYNLVGKYVILGVASVWEKRKGFDDFIELSHLLDDNYRIILVGLNEKQMKTLPQNVIGIKRTNSAEELAEIYSYPLCFRDPLLQKAHDFCTLHLTFPTASCRRDCFCGFQAFQTFCRYTYLSRSGSVIRHLT
ncbi:MAG: glycosyltransferase [Ruminococcus sp.]|nr:glycosyltransferase [Ruminococcus sp.]